MMGAVLQGKQRAVAAWLTALWWSSVLATWGSRPHSKSAPPGDVTVVAERASTPIRTNFEFCILVEIIFRVWGHLIMA